MNYQTPAGWMKVEILDENGDAVPGYAEADCDLLQGDSVDQIVTWGPQVELPSLAGPLRLRFVMQNASLYSFMAGLEVQVLPGPSISWGIQMVISTSNIMADRRLSRSLVKLPIPPLQ